MAASALANEELRGINKTSKILVPGVFQTILACAAFMFVGPALVMANKEIMQDLKFDYPLALSSLGLISSSVIIHVGVWFGLFNGLTPESAAAVSGRAWFWTALPIGVAKGLTLASGNEVYLHLGLGFIQMLKAFTPAIVMAMMPLVGATRPPRLAIISVFLVVLGTLAEVKESFSSTYYGLFLMLSSEVLEAFNLVLTQVLLQNNRLTVVEGLYVLAPVGAASLILLSLIMEFPRMMKNQALTIVAQHPLYFLSVCILGFLVNFLALAVVRVTSSLTLKILNLARCVGLVFVGVIFYGESISVQQRVGYTVAVVGFIGYNAATIYPEESDRFLAGCCDCSRRDHPRRNSVSCFGSGGPADEGHDAGEHKRAV
eukprot:TRINITY_DN48223_c0_g1_i1.p1 TRINITY_DN48223_c0_g1~~TRINITY_DN48223_c0_g1_i1.p1  ORF type:complete len:373 (-),score=47.58 TRINITY_DN48223_c0_g1_i1:33-1151(-)